MSLPKSDPINSQTVAKQTKSTIKKKKQAIKDGLKTIVHINHLANNNANGFDQQTALLAIQMLNQFYETNKALIIDMIHKGELNLDQGNPGWALIHNHFAEQLMRAKIGDAQYDRLVHGTARTAYFDVLEQDNEFLDQSSLNIYPEYGYDDGYNIDHAIGSYHDQSYVPQLVYAELLLFSFIAMIICFCFVCLVGTISGYGCSVFQKKFKHKKKSQSQYENV
eukprot:398092_1